MISTIIGNWLFNYSFLSRNKIEKACNVPQGTLSRAINGRSAIPSHHIMDILNVLCDYGFHYNGYRFIVNSHSGQIEVFDHSLVKIDTVYHLSDIESTINIIDSRIAVSR